MRRRAIVTTLLSCTDQNRRGNYLQKNKMRHTAVVALGVAVLAVTGCSGGGSAGDASASSSASAATAQTAVPDVTGLDGAAAKAAIEQMGFVVDWGDEVVFRPANWNVDLQDPAGGVLADEGATVTLTVSKPSASAPSSDDDGPRSEAFERALQDSFGGQSYEEVFAADPMAWYGWIDAARVEGSNAYVTLKVGYESPDRAPLGEQAAKALSTLLPATAVEDISWIIVEDASNVVIAQQQPKPLI